jgi:hypothetical protein
LAICTKIVFGQIAEDPRHCCLGSCRRFGRCVRCESPQRVIARCGWHWPESNRQQAERQDARFLLISLRVGLAPPALLVERVVRWGIDPHPLRNQTIPLFRSLVESSNLHWGRCLQVSKDYSTLDYICQLLSNSPWFFI